MSRTEVDVVKEFTDKLMALGHLELRLAIANDETEKLVYESNKLLNSIKSLNIELKKIQDDKAKITEEAPVEQPKAD